MSEMLRVEQVAVDRWGRASGFELNLPKDDFVVLYGPNESGKTSLATALAWLIAGPGTRELLRRFGAEGETLAARLSGRLGTESLRIETMTRVPRRGSQAAASETFEASVGTTSVSRADLTARLGGGDFVSYKRFYWVEALEVADGSNLQERVTVQAVFGGVNPFAESKRLSDGARELLGASRGKPSSRTALALHRRAHDLEKELRTLSDTKREWARIEAEISNADSGREAAESRGAEMQRSLASACRALDAFSQGLVASRNDAAKALSDTPKPTANDERLHEQTTLARERIGDLRSAQNEAASAQSAFEAAGDAVHASWRPLIGADELGEAGLVAAENAERRLRDSCDQRQAAEAARDRAQKRLEHGTTDFDRLAAEWRERAPDDLAPNHVPTTGDIESAGPHERRDPAPSRTLGGRRAANRYATAAFAAAALGIVALAAVLAVQGEWPTAAVAALSGLALGAALVLAPRQGKPPGQELVELARDYKAARNERGAASQELGDAQRDLDRLSDLVDSLHRDYRQTMDALGVPNELTERFEPATVQHLRAVREAQSAGARLARVREASTRRLAEVSNLFAASAADAPAGEPAKASAAQGGATSPDAAVMRRHGEERQDRSAPATVEILDAAGSEALLRAACERVDRHRTAEHEAREAERRLQRAVHHDETALIHIEGGSPETVRAQQRELREEHDRLESDLDKTKERITGLGVDKRALESTENRAAELALHRSELSERIEDAVVRGLGHHLAASLLRGAAERHRRERQPELLRRTQDLVCGVADWTGVTMNPHAAAGGNSVGHTDNLLVDGPRGEHSARRQSLGAQALLYLGLRLATVEDQAKARGVRLPVILDDVLFGLDDRRCEKVLDNLSEFSERHQLILLTCHERTKQRAQDAGACFVPVPPP